MPRKIERLNPSEISIRWDDEHAGRHSLRALRKYCPCAGCKQEIESHEGVAVLPILTPGQYDLKSIEPVGNYALQIVWGDGHRTGIYTFDYLRQICECSECMKTTAE